MATNRTNKADTIDPRQQDLFATPVMEDDDEAYIASLPDPVPKFSMDPKRCQYISGDLKAGTACQCQEKKAFVFGRLQSWCEEHYRATHIKGSALAVLMDKPDWIG